MDDFETDGENAEENKKKKGGKDEAGATGRTEAVVSQGFYEKMGLLGASSNLIAEILQSWKHLQGQSLLQRLVDFSRGKARASAHAEVDIKKGKDFGIVHNLFQSLKSLPRTLAQKLRPDHHHTPGPQ